MSRKYERRGTIGGLFGGSMIGAKIGSHIGIAAAGTAIPGIIPVAITAGAIGMLSGNKIGSEIDRAKNI